MSRSFIRAACILIGGNLLVAATSTFAQSATAAQVMQACRTGDPANLELIGEGDLTKETATPLILSLDNVTELGQTIATADEASEWSFENTIIVAFGQQTDMLRTGGVSGELLRSELGILYRWEDRFLGTICLMGLPASIKPDRRPMPPTVKSTSIFWRAAPTGDNAKFTSQIIMISDRPK